MSTRTSPGMKSRFSTDKILSTSMKFSEICTIDIPDFIAPEKIIFSGSNNFLTSDVVYPQSRGLEPEGAVPGCPRRRRQVLRIDAQAHALVHAGLGLHDLRRAALVN